MEPPSDALASLPSSEPSLENALWRALQAGAIEEATRAVTALAKVRLLRPYDDDAREVSAAAANADCSGTLPAPWRAERPRAAIQALCTWKSSARM